jgi:Cys-tRNA(Pro)/Cys-tRNA(Cys) deacylase
MTDLLDGIPGHLLNFLKTHNIDLDFLAPGVPMSTVPTAAAAIGVPEEQILKTLLFAGDDGTYVVAIANGTRRIERKRLVAAASVPTLRPANPADVLAVTGYPAGGVAPLGLPAAVPVIVDAATAELSFAYGGGGQESLLLRVQISDVIRYNNALVADITERPKHATR